MLKIKDSVDLKELEKYGFKLHQDNEHECYEVLINDKNWNSASLKVAPISRNLIINTGATYISSKLDIIYSLIEDGLVEKVVR